MVDYIKEVYALHRGEAPQALIAPVAEAITEVKKTVKKVKAAEVQESVRVTRKAAVPKATL
jgi:hypothetical protein